MSACRYGPLHCDSRGGLGVSRLGRSDAANERRRRRRSVVRRAWRARLAALRPPQRTHGELRFPRVGTYPFPIDEVGVNMRPFFLHEQSSRVMGARLTSMDPRTTVSGEVGADNPSDGASASTFADECADTHLPPAPTQRTRRRPDRRRRGREHGGAPDEVREVHLDPEARRRGDGRVVPGDSAERRGLREADRHQTNPAGDEPGSRLHRHAPARGAHRRDAVAPEQRPNVRRRADRRQLLHRDGARARRGSSLDRAADAQEGGHRVSPRARNLDACSACAPGLRTCAREARPRRHGAEHRPP